MNLQLVAILGEKVDDFFVIELEHGDLHQKLSSRGT
jgi:hypothetical protein